MVECIASIRSINQHLRNFKTVLVDNEDDIASDHYLDTYMIYTL